MCSQSQKLIILWTLWTGSEGNPKGRGLAAPLFSAASSHPSQISLQMAWETCVQALLQKWISESALGRGKKKLLAGFIFLSWFIWQGPILYLVLEFQNLAYLQRSLLKHQRRTKREARYVTPCKTLPEPWKHLPFYFYFLTRRSHRLQNRGWAALSSIRGESDLH